MVADQVNRPEALSAVASELGLVLLLLWTWRARRSWRPPPADRPQSSRCPGVRRGAQAPALALSTSPVLCGPRNSVCSRRSGPPSPPVRSPSQDQLVDSIHPHERSPAAPGQGSTYPSTVLADTGASQPPQSQIEVAFACRYSVGDQLSNLPGPVDQRQRTALELLLGIADSAASPLSASGLCRIRPGGRAAPSPPPPATPGSASGPGFAPNPPTALTPTYSQCFPSSWAASPCCSSEDT